jgi:glycosyltransferase involved in cell wall biosynthesis
MVLAINTIAFLQEEKGNDFFYETFSRIIRAHPKHTFIFISENSSNLFLSSPNVIDTNVGPAPKHRLKLLIWFHFKIKKILKKYKADIFISKEICFLTSKIPQILVASDPSFTYPPSFGNKNSVPFYKKASSLFFKKAEVIIVFSEFEKAAILKKYKKIDEDKIKVIYHGVKEMDKLVNFQEREEIKNEYADGNEYFLYPGIISLQSNLISLLKAFSAFKKRQRSSMQLIIAGKPGKDFDEFLKSLELYKFKKEVKLLPELPGNEIEKIIASSYAIVYPVVYEASATMLLKAMKNEIPLLVSSESIMPEICAGSALYFNPENYKDIAEKMMLIFKDEKLRKEMAEKGKEQSKKFDWNESAESFWKTIQAVEIKNKK